MIIEKILLWMFSSGRPEAAKQRTAQRSRNDNAPPKTGKAPGTPPRIQRPTKTFRPPDPPSLKRPTVEAPKIETPIVSVPKVTMPKVSVPKVSVPKASIPKVRVPRVEMPNVELPDLSDVKLAAPVLHDNWFKRTVRNNRVVIASMIAIALFAYGGAAWSKRKPRLVRKAVTTEPQTERMSGEFDELLDIPVYKGVDPQLQNDGRDVMRQASNHLETMPSGSVSDYDPFDSLSIEDTQSPFSAQDAEFSEVFSQSEVEEVSSDPVFEEPAMQTPGLAFPTADETPTLDSGDATPLLRIGFEGH